MNLDKIIVSENSFKSNEASDIINSNISVINLLREEGIEDENIHEDALTSYYLDYYEVQYKNGNFSQFVWNSKWLPDLNEIIKEGLEQIGALQHLDLFNRQCAIVDNLPQKELEKFLKSQYLGENPTRDKLKNDDFFELNENIQDLNAKWLKNHPDLKVLSIENMFLEIEQFVGREIKR